MPNGIEAGDRTALSNSDNKLDDCEKCFTLPGDRLLLKTLPTAKVKVNFTNDDRAIGLQLSYTPGGIVLEASAKGEANRALKIDLKTNASQKQPGCIPHKSFWRCLQRIAGLVLVHSYLIWL
jgi:hypothetical protein